MSREMNAEIMARVEESKQRRHELMPDERAAIRMLTEAHHRLEELGWRAPCYCPKDGTHFDVIELGSTGIHDCYYEGEWPTGGWWVVGDDGDSGPSHPALFRAKRS